MLILDIYQLSPLINFWHKMVEHLSLVVVAALDQDILLDIGQEIM